MMRGGVSLKSIIVMVILLLVGVLGVLGIDTAKNYLSGAAADSEPKNITAKPGEGGKSASISWTSDKPTSGVVEYGTTLASLLLRALESDAATDHAVNLQPLKPNTNYYYRIRVGEEVYDNSGIPFSFKTNETVAVESTPTEKPKISVEPTVPPADQKCKPGTDYNKDGVVNSMDMIVCARGSAPPGLEPTKAVGAPPASTCKSDVDYDGNGVINSIDRIKCLQGGG